MEFWQEQKELDERLRNVRRTMLDVIPMEGKLPDMARRQVENPGKQLRPALLILCAGLDFRKEASDRMAAALEYLHMASLVHDDIVDQSDQRRGKPSAAYQYGISMALYLGDYLIWLALKCLSGVKQTMLPDRLLEFMNPLLESEAEQLERRWSQDISREQYIERIQAKTGLLFGYGAAAGFALRSRSPEDIEAVRSAGIAFGTAFQLRDDLSDHEDPGFPDLKEGNFTAPVLLALSEDPELKKILSQLRTRPEPELMAEAVRRSNAAGGPEQTRQILAEQLLKAEPVFRKQMGPREWTIYSWMTGKLFGGSHGN